MTTTTDTSLDKQEVLLANLQQAHLYSHPIENFKLLQTHISWVLLTGPYAYKFKKPVDLGFLNFSTLALRRHYCEEELRLNRRFADDLYLEVVNITGDIEHPQFNGKGDTVEYAVKMKQFPQSAQLDIILADNLLTPQHIDSLADAIADFHIRSGSAGTDTAYGDADNILDPVIENFSHIYKVSPLSSYTPRLKKLESWCHKQFDQLQSQFMQRKLSGWIREGHGDMHLRNMALLNDRVILFDCLEFNDGLRWIDVINDLAFLLMDLDDRGQSSFAWRCLNRYLQQTGDYDGLKLLAFYKVYRALVRAKVDAIRLTQAHLTTEEQQKTAEDFRAYLELAESYTEKNKISLILTRGLSGSGKTTLSQAVLEKMGAIRVRSDVERKRVFGKSTDLYNKDITQKVYLHLLKLAEQCLHAGYPVIIDATFIDTQQISSFHSLATHMGIPFHILEFNAKPDTLRTRLKQRQAEYSDANLDVLENQLSLWHSVPKELNANLIAIDTESEFDVEKIMSKLV